jgi:Ca2+-binding RTX toxin-like protein
VGVRCLLTLLAGLAVPALIWPAVSAADHIVTSATVTARLKERKSTDLWVVEIRWTANCTGAAPGTAWFGGHINLVDADTGERIDAGDVVSTSGESAISGMRDWSVSSRARPQRLFSELTISCYENFPLHGGREVVVTGASVLVPEQLGGGSGGSSGGSGGGGSGSGDPSAPLESGGCVAALVGTNEPDTLTGGDAGEVILGYGGKDRIRGGRGHDCLLGHDGDDVLRGEAGEDRITGGRGSA